ncbi:DMT family transporter [Pseudazoarcus pumilus]|uniref:EamA family transporter n=1 Tax=Pseudazoarcus pumilus TaxID=2067960 RepID=A0A2I6S5G7_9RHOO|nr:EamA family transporter [Pseudazoarcus pumilus]AUN94499.1 EamA family transporter [Pseudazoarcus pumilus]
MSESRRAWPALAAFVLLSLIWGYNWVVMKKVLQFADPVDFTALRVIFGTVALFALMLLRRMPLRPVALGPTIVLGLLQCGAFSVLIQLALVHGGAGKTAVLVYVMPFWLLPMAWAFLGERVRGLQWVAVAMAALGLVFVLEPWSVQASLMSNAIALLASVVWASAAIYAKRLRARVRLELVSLTAWQMLFGAIVLAVFAWLLPSRPIEPTPYFFGALAYNAILATALAWLLWLFVLDRLPAGVAGLSSLAVPAVGVLSAWLELGERPSLAEGGGMMLIAAALALLSWLVLRATPARRARQER